jgi:hypothetical protein
MSKTQFTRDDLPPGCMISLAATHVAPALDPIRDMMAGHRALSEATLAERLRKSDSLYARARVNVNLELSRSGKRCQERISATGWAW